MTKAGVITPTCASVQKPPCDRSMIPSMAPLQKKRETKSIARVERMLALRRCRA